MSVQQRTNVAYSLNEPLSSIFPSPIVALRDPATTDKAQIGTLWVNKSTNDAFVITSIVSNSASWISIAGGEGQFSEIVVGTFLIDTVGADTFMTKFGGAIIMGGPDISILSNSTLTLDAAVGAASLSGDSIVIASTAGNVGITSTTGSLGLSSDTTLDLTAATSINLTIAPIVNLGTGAGVITTNIGGSAVNSTVNIGTTGLVTVAPNAATVASPTTTSTQNFNVLKATFTGFTTAAAASQSFLIASSKILSTSGILVNVTNLNASTNGAALSITGTVQATGSIVVTVKNNGSGALGSGDNVIVTVWIIS